MKNFIFLKFFQHKIKTETQHLQSDLWIGIVEVMIV